MAVIIKRAAQGFFQPRPQDLDSPRTRQLSLLKVKCDGRDRYLRQRSLKSDQNIFDQIWHSFVYIIFIF